MFGLIAMTGKTKRSLFFGAIGVFILFGAWLWHGFRPESRFKALFADLSIEAPEYHTFLDFSQPLDAVKGDYFDLDVSQSDIQFREFVKRVGVSEESVLSSNGTWVSADSKIDPKYPWKLNIHADATNSSDKIFRLHIEGRQPYD
ncbi:MAG TPA: hypothetical protein VNN22_09905 [Verrucomicrobiae bacterium]|nr:hypothetical protein [Verrucomicrobiae bacterium]